MVFGDEDTILCLCLGIVGEGFVGAGELSDTRFMHFEWKKSLLSHTDGSVCCTAAVAVDMSSSGQQFSPCRETYSSESLESGAVLRGCQTVDGTFVCGRRLTHSPETRSLGTRSGPGICSVV